jgi:hypothetical protein
MADELNFQLPESGFDSYLAGIIPEDQAVLAGAFSVAMQQIRNIQTVDIQKFAQVAYNIESMAGLPLVNGTDIPTNLQLATFAKSKTAIGAGIYGTYTMSNFFGCMSGLPYPLNAIYDGIKQLETDKLKIIYQQLYWTVTAKQAQGTILPSQITLSAVESPPSSGNYDYYYQITGVTLTDPGGGYGRGGASAPVVTISGTSGATAICTIDTNPNNVPGTFGQVLTLTLTSAGSNVLYDSGPSPTPTDPGLTVTFECPPDEILSYPYTTGGSNGVSINWTDINDYITDILVEDANNEILAIKNANASNFTTATILNTNWDITGTALKQEQRARHNAIPPVTIPYDYWASLYPTSLIVFTDSIPQFALQTEPHMTAQTLEHISNIKNTGGQSVVGLMRQERNQDRLAEVGIELDNNISDQLDINLEKRLMSNGTLPGAVEGIEAPDGNIYTIPAWPENTNPIAYWDCDANALRIVTGLKEGTVLPILEGDGCPIVNPEVPVGPGPFPEPPINIFVVEDPLPPEINTNYTGTTLKPSTYDVNDAIDKVIECNCDCWVD